MSADTASYGLHVGPQVKAQATRQFVTPAAPPPPPTPGEPRRGGFIVKSRAVQNLQFRATVEGHEFLSDEGLEAGGNDAGPAPLRYFLAGIMMCHQVMTVKSATLLDLKLHHLESEISGVMGRPAEGEPGGFVRVILNVSIESQNSDDQIRKIVEQAGQRCPAFVTIQRAAAVDLTLKHNGQVIQERTYEVQSR
ncbi:MAG: OsmC family protein [Chloroflexi bacterium]|nr:OsmC family protein [Chloroflexota bacterium]